MLVWAASALFVWSQLDQGWVAHDEGALGQSAERVLDGEMPHRDFDELYTGGLSYVNAAAFRIGGIRLTVMRRVLFAVFLLWIPAVFYIASRFVSPFLAAAVTALAAAWSLPVYSAPMPSWYNLFLAVFGVAALLRHLETGRARWLFLGGLAGGLSVLVKVTGIYFLIAGGLFLLFLEATRDGDARGSDVRGSNAPAGDALVTVATPAGDRPGDGARNRLFRLFLVAVTLLLVAGLAGVIRARFGPKEIVDFLLPGAVTAGLLAGAGFHRAARRGRLRSLVRMSVPFAAGVMAPVSAFVAVFAAAGAAGDLLRGVFVAPLLRMDYAAYEGPALATLAWALPVPALLLLGARLPQRVRWAAALPVAAGLFLVWRTGHLPPVYGAVWLSVRWLIPVVTVAAAVILVRRRREAEADPRWGGLFLLVAAAAFGGLVQYPYSAPVYFFYAAPLVLLAGTAVAAGGRNGADPDSRRPRPGIAARPILAAVVLFHLAFAVRWIDSGFIYSLGIGYASDPHTAELDLPRGGLRVTPADRQVYRALVETVDGLDPGEYIYVTPDAPQVYFLTGRRNPTRTLFDFFDDPDDGPGLVLDALERRQVSVVVINRWPRFSRLPAVELQTTLAALYPQAINLGHFIVRWRE